MILWLLTAAAAPLSTGQGTPFPMEEGRWTVGLTSAARWGLDERTELSTTGLPSLVAPRVEVKRLVWTDDTGDLGLAVRGGIGFPTMGLSLLRGTVLSSDPNQVVGFGTVIRLGSVAGWRMGPVTAGLDLGLRMGLVGGWTMDPPGLPFLDLWLSPLAEGIVDTRLKLHLDYYWEDAGGTDRWGVEWDGAVHLNTGGPDVWSRGLVVVAAGPHVTLGLGTVVANERLAYGRQTLLAPMGDVRLRW